MLKTITIDTSDDATVVWNYFQKHKDEKGHTTLRRDGLRSIGGLNHSETLDGLEELKEKGLAWWDEVDKTISIRVQ